MAPRKTVNNFWNILISILLFILILLVIFLIYLYYNKKEIVKATNFDKKTTNDNVIIIKEKNDDRNDIKDIPVYPKKLPTYNNKSYQQIGILTSDETDKDPIVLPLFSKKLNNHNDRFNYYTATDKNNMMRLPVKFDNMNCEDDIGCREIYNNDKINIEIYKGRTFTATIYKVDTPQYFADEY